MAKLLNDSSNHKSIKSDYYIKKGVLNLEDIDIDINSNK